MARSPLVSVLIPAYRSSEYIRAAIESALSQTVRDLEVVFVDDGPEDAAAIADGYAANDPRVRVFRNERNLGTTRTVNRAIDEARGVWVAQHDDDDTWRPERLERLLEVSGRADIVSDDIEVSGETGDPKRGFQPGGMLEQLGIRLRDPHYWELVEFIRFDPGLVHPLIKRELLEQKSLRLDTRFSIGADFGLWVRLLARDARWIQLPEAYYIWSPTATSQTARLTAMAEEAQRMTNALITDSVVARNPRAVAALHRRAHLFRSHVAHARVRSLLSRKRYGDLAKAVARDPRIAWNVGWRKSVYLRLGLRRRLASSGARPPRSPRFC